MLHTRIECPNCHWKDDGDEHQLRIAEMAIAGFVIWVRIECSECGRVNIARLVPTWECLESADMGYSVPVKSIIPF